MDSGGWEDILRGVGMFASVVLPLWNIPLIVRIIRRRSSEDLSMAWAWGVWICLTLMVPPALVSPDAVFRVFGMTNWAFFTAVVGVAWKYRKR